MYNMRVILNFERLIVLKQEYATRQKQIVVDFLRRNRDRQLSMAEVADGVSDEVGKSTVYRQVSKLCDEGVLRRFRGENAKSVVYQYVGAFGGCDSHFHLKCSTCGKIIHLDCGQIMQLRRHIMQSHGFFVDLKDTVLYGICDTCRTGERGSAVK